MGSDTVIFLYHTIITRTESSGRVAEKSVPRFLSLTQTRFPAKKNKKINNLKAIIVMLSFFVHVHVLLPLLR